MNYSFCPNDTLNRSKFGRGKKQPAWFLFFSAASCRCRLRTLFQQSVLHGGMKLIVWQALVAAALVLVCLPALGQTSSQKIGFVNTNEILQKSPQAKAVTNRLRREFEGRESRVQDCNDAFWKLDSSLRREGRTMDESKRERMVGQARSKKRECEELQSRFQEDLNKRRNEEVSIFQREVIETVERLAKRRGLAIVLNPTAVIYVDEKVDLTEQVLDALAKKYEQ